MNLERLHSLIAAAGIPVVSVEGEPGNVRIHCPQATPAQRAAAQAIADGMDWSQPAEDAWQEDQKPHRKALRQAAAQAIADNDAFLALANPSNAQTLQQVRRLTQQSTAVIRRLIQID